VISNLTLVRRSFPRTGIAGLVLVLAALGGGAAEAADVGRGRSTYTTHCAVCHGADGTPVMPGAPNFRRMESLMRPDMQLMVTIRQGKGTMPGFFGVLRDRDILDVVAYLRTLS
jgi:cytochrome c6